MLLPIWFLLEMCITTIKQAYVDSLRGSVLYPNPNTIFEEISSFITPSPIFVSHFAIFLVILSILVSLSSLNSSLQTVIHAFFGLIFVVITLYLFRNCARQKWDRPILFL